MNVLHAKLIKLTETTLASLETEITTEATSALTRARKLMEDDANLANVNASVDDFISNEDPEILQFLYHLFQSNKPTLIVSRF